MRSIVLLFKSRVKNTVGISYQNDQVYRNHYFCDVLPLLNLSCSSTYLNELPLFIIAELNSLFPTLVVIISHVFMFCNILCISSKVFGTCSSHLMAMGIFFGSITFMYFQPPSSNTLEEEKVSSVFYTTVIPCWAH